MATKASDTSGKQPSAVRQETMLTHGGRSELAGDFINPPIVRGSTVLHANVADMKERSRRYRSAEPGPVNYGMYGTATHHALFELLSELEGGYRSWAVPSGIGIIRHMRATPDGNIVIHQSSSNRVGLVTIAKK